MIGKALLVLCSLSIFSFSAQATILGPAAPFNAFIFTTMTSVNGDTEGRLAVGGNATLTNWGVAQNFPGSAKGETDLVVGGNLKWTNGQLFKGDGKVGGTITTTGVGTPNGTITTGTAIDFTDARNQLTQTSAYLGSLASNGTTSIAYNGISMMGTDALLNVFNLSTANLNVANNWKISAPAGSTVLVNITGTSAVMQNFAMQLSGVTAATVLLNFSDASSLKITNLSPEGSILAPFADVNFQNGHVVGNFVANSLVSTNAQFNYPIFTGNLPEPPVATPEPTSLAMLVMGGSVLGAAVRRRMRARS